MDWREELGEVMKGKARMTRAEKENAAFETFLQEVAAPALEEVAVELRKHSRLAQVRSAPASVKLQVVFEGKEEIAFSVLKKYVNDGILPMAEVRIVRGAQGQAKYESMIREGAEQDYQISDVSAQDVIGCFIRHYRMTMNDPRA